jgi:hypothetical protein
VCTTERQCRENVCLLWAEVCLCVCVCPSTFTIERHIESTFENLLRDGSWFSFAFSLEHSL